MHYFAGLFDAEGYVSLLKTGNFIIGTEMTNEQVPNLFKETFGGSIYTRKRGERKKTFTWMIGTNHEQALNFISQIAPFSIIKRPQLLHLADYINIPKELKKVMRQPMISQMRKLKTPFYKPTFDEPSIHKCENSPDTPFYEWLAGFFDGDGNFSLYETHKGEYWAFQSWIGVFNTFWDPIDIISDRLQGSISQYKGRNHPVYKWVCSQSIEKSVCQSLLPFLKIKKAACQVILDYHEIKKKKTRFVSYSGEDQKRIRDLIKQIKHINSL